MVVWVILGAFVDVMHCLLVQQDTHVNLLVHLNSHGDKTQQQGTRTNTIPSIDNMMVLKVCCAKVMSKDPHQSPGV